MLPYKIYSFFKVIYELYVYISCYIMELFCIIIKIKVDVSGFLHQGGVVPVISTKSTGRFG